eukprot:scaffold38251_cov34-Attheya_sp.AAC.2
MRSLDGCGVCLLMCKQRRGRVGAMEDDKANGREPTSIALLLWLRCSQDRRVDTVDIDRE